MSLKNALYELLNSLDKVNDTYQVGMGDTAVREDLHIAMIEYFVYAPSRGDFPSEAEYSTLNDEADEEIHKALGQFLNHPEVRVALAELTPQERLDAFQDHEVKSSNGRTYDNYFGWVEHL